MISIIKGGHRFEAEVKAADKKGRGEEMRTMMEEEEEEEEEGWGSHQKTPAGFINPTSDCVHILKCRAD